MCSVTCIILYFIKCNFWSIYCIHLCVFLGTVIVYIHLINGLWIIKFCFPLYMCYLKYGPPVARFQVLKAVILGCDFV